MLRGVAAGAAVTATAALMAGAPTEAAASSPADTLGVYRGAGNPSTIADWEAWIDRPAARITDYFARSTWSDITNPWIVNQWAGTGRQLVYGLPMLPSSGAGLAQAASGAYNGYFRTVAQNLVNAGQPDAVLRLGLEFNGNWFPWHIGVSNGPQDFAAAWRQIIGAIRSVPGAAFKFDWCVALGGSWFNGAQIDPARAYPGDQYVDYIGMDVYDQDWMPGYQDPIQRWQNLMNQPYGLAWHRAFAAQHAKPMTFPEWGLADRSDGHGGGDNPYFIQKMHDWIAANDVAYQMYFEYDESDSLHELMGGRFPTASATFQSLFGTAQSSPPPAGDEASSTPSTPSTDPAAQPVSTVTGTSGKVGKRKRKARRARARAARRHRR